MTKKPGWQFIGIFLFLLPAFFVEASNIAEEVRIYSEIQKQLKQGELIELEANGKKFFGIYQKSSLPVTHGGVIILHGLNLNPDSPSVINPLRTSLTRSGWDTLALQMPVPAMDSAGNIFPELSAVYPTLASEATARINAAVTYFSEKENTNLVMVGHGLGANMATTYLAGESAAQFQSFAAISMNHKQPADFADNLSKLEIPLLDVYGSRDITPVVSGAQNRKAAIVADGENPQYRQSMIEGADHYYTGLESELMSTVRAWLRKTSPGETITTSK